MRHQVKSGKAGKASKASKTSQAGKAGIAEARHHLTFEPPLRMPKDAASGVVQTTADISMNSLPASLARI